MAPPVTEIWEEPNLFSMYARSCCQRAELTSSHRRHHHLFTVQDTPPPPPPPSHRHTKASYLQRRPSPLMTASLHSTDHSALKPFFLEERISAPFTPYRDQMTSLKATDSRLICEIGGARNFLYSGHWRESWREAVRNFIPEISAPQTAVTRPSFHPPLLHLT